MAAVWSVNNMACIATYNILEGDNLLNQFDHMFLGIDKAGAFKLSSLPYYPKFGAAPDDIEGRAAQMARNFFKYIVTYYTNRKEHSSDAVETIMGAFKAQFSSTTATIADLAAEANKYFQFSSRP